MWQKKIGKRKKTKPSKLSIEKLTDYPKKKIFSFLTVKELIVLEKVCKNFRRLISKNENGFSLYHLMMKDCASMKEIKEHLEVLQDVKLGKRCCVYKNKHFDCEGCISIICLESEAYSNEDNYYYCTGCSIQCDFCSRHFVPEHDLLECGICDSKYCRDCINMCCRCGSFICCSCVETCSRSIGTCRICIENI